MKNQFESEGDQVYNRAYKTGDLVRWTLDGNVDYIGRIDRQVKLRGFRMELGEIEALVSSSEGVDAAYVLVAKEYSLLVAFVTPGNVDGEKVRKEISAKVPYYMVPSAIVAMDAFPLTTNGKVDYKKLEIPDLSNVASNGSDAGAYVAPEGEMELALAEIFQVALGTEDISATSSFFDLGGHSLKAMRVIHDIQALLESSSGYESCNVKVGDLFANPSVSELASHLESMVAAGSGIPAPEPLDCNYAPFRSRREGCTTSTGFAGGATAATTHPWL